MKCSEQEESKQNSTKEDEFLPVIQTFITNKQRNEWLEFPTLSVYVRRGFHMVDDKLRATFDIANVKVVEQEQNSGVFTGFLAVVEQLNFPIYVESILSKRFADFFRKRGYKVTEHSETFTAFRDSPDAWWLPVTKLIS